MRYAVLLILMIVVCVTLSCVAAVTAGDPLVLRMNVAAGAMLFTTCPDPDQPGRWLVCRPVPGSINALAAIASCPTQQAADRECAWQQAEFDRTHQADTARAWLHGTQRNRPARGAFA